MRSPVPNSTRSSMCASCMCRMLEGPSTTNKLSRYVIIQIVAKPFRGFIYYNLICFRTFKFAKIVLMLMNSNCYNQALFFNLSGILKMIKKLGIVEWLRR